MDYGRDPPPRYNPAVGSAHSFHEAPLTRPPRHSPPVRPHSLQETPGTRTSRHTPPVRPAHFFQETQGTRPPRYSPPVRHAHSFQESPGTRPPRHSPPVRHAHSFQETPGTRPPRHSPPIRPGHSLYEAPRTRPPRQNPPVGPAHSFHEAPRTHSEPNQLSSGNILASEPYQMNRSLEPSPQSWTALTRPPEEPHVSYQQPQHPSYQQPQHASLQQPPSANQACIEHMIESYVALSMAHTLYKYALPSIGPPRECHRIDGGQESTDQHEIVWGHRLQYCSCCLSWTGFVILSLYILLTVGMLLTGSFGSSYCSGGLVIYLLLGGSLMAVLLLVRSFTSILTAFRLTKHRTYSFKLTWFIFALEVFFFMLLGWNIVTTIIGSIFVFSNNILDCFKYDESMGCCPDVTIIIGIICNISQYLLFFITLGYIFNVLFWIHHFRGQRDP